MLAVQAEGNEITTIEGLRRCRAAPDAGGVPQNHGLQCGYCTPGMVMAATSLLAENPDPTEAEVRDGPRGEPLPLYRLSQHRQGSWPLRDAERSSWTGDATTTTEPSRRRITRVGDGCCARRTPPLLTGEARFVADLEVPGSAPPRPRAQPVAHARDHLGRPQPPPWAMPGVVAAFSGRRPARRLGRADFLAPGRSQPDMKSPAHLPLAVEQVAYCRRRGRRRGRRVGVRRARRRRGRRRRVRPAAGGRSTSSDARSDRVVVHEDARHELELLLGAHAGCRRRGGGLREGGPHRHGALRPAAAHPRRDGAAGRRRGPAALRGRVHGLLGHPDPPHLEDHARNHDRDPGDAPSGDRPFGRRRLRLEAQRLRRRAPLPSCSPSGSAQPDPLDRGAVREQPRPPSRAVARSRTSSSRPTPTADHCRPRELLADMGAYLQLVTPGIPLLGAFLYARRLRRPRLLVPRARRSSRP